MVTVQSIQPTPNPNAFKFVCDELLYQGTKNYATAAEASGHELAEQLFALEGVDTLFFCDKFVTVSMTAEADWRSVHEQATRVLGEAASPYGSGNPAPAAGAPQGAWQCGVECDGGTFTAWESGGSLLLRTRGGFLVSGACSEPGDEEPPRYVTDINAIQTTYRLDRIDIAKCDLDE